MIHKKGTMFYLLVFFSFLSAISGCGGGSGGGRRGGGGNGGGGTEGSIPDAPKDIKLIAADSQLTVSWEKVDNTTNYEVWYHTDNNSNEAKQYAEDSDPTDTNCIITGLVNGTTYYVWIRAKNNIGTSGFSTVVSAIPIPAVTAPNPPGRPVLTVGKGQLIVSWEAVIGATRYEVWYSTSNNSGSANLSTDSNPADLICAITGLTDGTIYYVWVKACNSSGTSDFSPVATGQPDGGTGGPIIIDHTCTDLTKIPTDAINNAKAKLVIAYGHTSHGNQLIYGMTGLVSWVRGGSLYSWNADGSGGALELHDFNGNFGGYGIANDLGAPNRTAWAEATRCYLGDHPETNVIIWSWCWQVDGTSEQINTYLYLMSELEEDFPNVKFVYMTGHLDGKGLEGNVHQRNEQIRKYCRDNNKILYDFADIETWGPDPSSDNPGDSSIYYGDKYPTDGCCYDANNSGSTTYINETTPTDGDRNWARDWQDSHIRGTHWYSCTSPHSVALNADRKAFAAWWLWARLAGWDGE